MPLHTERFILLADSENEYELSKTQLAQQYKWLIRQNPFFSAFFTNGGLIGEV